jgi:DNA-binding transcriptional LysR family regulator
MAYMRADLAKRRSISLRQLVHETVMVPEGGSMTQRVVKERTRDLGIELERLMSMRPFPIVKEAVLHGVGVGILLDASFYPSRQLVMRPITEIGEIFHTCLVAPADKSDLRSVRSFIEIAEGEIATSGYTVLGQASEPAHPPKLLGGRASPRWARSVFPS